MYQTILEKLMASILTYPESMRTNVTKYPHVVTFNAVTRNTTGNGGTTSTGEYVQMYMPADALKASYNQTFGDVDAGAAGIALGGVSSTQATGAMNALRGAVEGATAGNMSTAVAGLTKAFAEGSGAAKGLNIGTAIAQATVQEGIGGLSGGAGAARDLIMKKAGKIMNPHKAILYQGPGGFRVFNYNFTMTPESQKEAETIARIVHYFKYYMHPGVPGITRQVQGGGTQTTPQTINSSITLTYPEEFKISLKPRGKKTEGTRGTPGNASTNVSVAPLFKIDNCVLESLSVDYATSGGPAFIVDGITAPATTTLSLQFKETVLMTKSKIKDGY